MCITFVCTNGLSRRLRYKLILLNNRDEWLDRRTSAAHWSDDYLAEYFLSGRDEQAAERGTWLGITRSGRIGNLLSITETEAAKSLLRTPPSRGAIPANFLASSRSPAEFCDELQSSATAYHGFQLLALQRNREGLFDVASLTNRLVDEVKTYIYHPGAYVVGNSPREAPMRKVVYGELLFKRLLDELNESTPEAEISQRLISLGRDTTLHHPDPQIALQTGRDATYNRPLSSIFVRFPPEIRYGTRCHTVLLIDKDNNVYWREERMISVPHDPANADWETVEHRFKLE